MSVLLEDVSIRTMIGLLPRIINKNNKNLSDYIDNIYDSNKGCIKVSVDTRDNADSHVYSYTGKFKNIFVDNIVINDKNCINSFLTRNAITGDGISHSVFTDRYLYNNAGVITEVLDSSLPVGMSSYAHNAGAIGVGMNNGDTKSLLEVLNEIISNVDTLKSHFSGSYVSETLTYVNTYGSSLSATALSSSDESLSEPDSFTFDNQLLFSNRTLLKRMNLPEYQYNDLINGYIFTYYDYNTTVTISDEHTASIKGIPGSIVTVKFNDTQTKAYYRILLSRVDKKYLRVSKDELNRLTLICISNDDTNGTVWDVNNYSVRSAEDLMIETK